MPVLCRIFGKLFYYKVTFCKQALHVTFQEKEICQAAQYPVRAGVGKGIGHDCSAILFTEDMLMPEAFKSALCHFVYKIIRRLKNGDL